MSLNNKTKVTVETTIQLSAPEVWDLWTNPDHITKWNFASDDWQCPKAENDLRPGGRFTSRMEAKDGSMGFDFSGIYNQVDPNRLITYTMDDRRNVTVKFSEERGQTKVTEIFETEGIHSVEEQKNGWQSILNNFKKYAESVS